MYGSFPYTRLRRPRMNDWSRRLVREHHLRVDDLIWPTFVIEGQGTETVGTMPGVSRYGIEALVKKAKEAEDLGVPAIALFPVIGADKKSDNGEEAINPNNLICRAVKAVKAACPNLGIVCDVALDPYTTSGHDGVIINDEIDNDATVEILRQQALVQVEAGCDIVAPSDMMDGRVAAIRETLEEAGHKNSMIMSYAVKYASSFYGPFRDAVGSVSSFGKKDKKTYQQDPANGTEALREAALDIEEGADILMVKPGMPYLDVLKTIREKSLLPLAAYQVSGEYAMIKFAAQAGAIDEEKAMMESLLAFKRAGADMILTYFALDAAKFLQR